MTQIDPHRTLGVAPDASQAEIKRAYRRLAKQYHPDSGGDRQLPRFLAIQAAYEALVDDERSGRRPGSAGRASRPADPPSWQADPARARATRDAYRTRRRGPASGSAGSRPPPLARPGLRTRAPAGPAGRVRGGPPGGSSGSGPAPRPGGPRLGRAGRRRARRRDRPRRQSIAAPGEGDDRLDELRRRGSRTVRPGLGRGHLVRGRQRDLLDDQPEGVRRPSQARPRVPRPIAPAGRASRRRPGGPAPTAGSADPTGGAPRRRPSRPDGGRPRRRRELRGRARPAPAREPPGVGSRRPDRGRGDPAAPDRGHARPASRRRAAGRPLGRLAAERRSTLAGSRRGLVTGPIAPTPAAPRRRTAAGAARPAGDRAHRRDPAGGRSPGVGRRVRTVVARAGSRTMTG